MSLSKVVIGGFRSIKETAVIPLAPITLMFGPNSAGKTSVLRGLEMLQAVLRTRTRGENIEPLEGLHWFHRFGREHHSTNLTLGAELVNCQLHCDVAALNWAGLGQIESASVIDVGLLEYRFTLDRALENDDKWRLTLNGEEVFSVHRVKDTPSQGLPPLWFPFGRQLLLLNLECDWVNRLPSVRRLVKRVQSAGKKPVYLKHVQLQEGQCAIPLWVHRGRLVSWLADPMETGELDDFLDGLTDDQVKELEAANLSVESVLAEMNAVIDAVEQALIKEVEVMIVPGGRGLLTPEQLTYPLHSEVVPRQHARTLPEAFECYATTLFCASKASTSASVQPKRPDLVNQVLSEGLFGKRIYRFYPAATRVMESDISLKPGGGRKRWSDPSPVGSTCHLRLTDGQNRLLSIEDVGSGVSYVLPVLVALWQAKLSWVEQPELHLHPAAQCEIADAFIRAFHLGHFSVIETHSEHLLLRLLRRVRQTHADQQANPDLRCPAEAVCVLYFDPQDDGSTHVHQLRVSRTGDFLDKWPAGFFDERYGELFDE